MVKLTFDWLINKISNDVSGLYIACPFSVKASNNNYLVIDQRSVKCYLMWGGQEGMGSGWAGGNRWWTGEREQVVGGQKGMGGEQARRNG